MGIGSVIAVVVGTRVAMAAIIWLHDVQPIHERPAASDDTAVI